MKNIKYFFLILLLLQLSCVKDNTVNSFKEINDITIEGIEESYNVELSSILSINPTITESVNGDGDLEYVWYKFNEAQYSADTISREKNLSYEIEDIIPGVATTLGFKVTNKKTGIYTRKQATLNVSGRYTDGTLILHRTGNDTELSFMKSKMDLLYENIYQDENEGKKLGVESKKLFVINPNLNNVNAYKAVIVTSDDNTGGVYLAPHTLEFKSSMIDKFPYADLTGNINITSHSIDQLGDYLIVNGKYHTRMNQYDVSTANWQPEVVVLSDPKDYYLSDAISQPFVNPLFGIPLVYDNLNGRFMYNYSKGFFRLFSTSSIKGTAFDPRNMGNLDMMASGCLAGNEDQIWALMKDDTNGDLYVISYIMPEDEINEAVIMETLSKTLIDRDKCPNIYNGKNFIPGTARYLESSGDYGSYLYGLSGTFFFTSNDKVYAFNTETISEAVLIDAAAANCSISMIKCQSIPEPTVNNPNARYMRIGVALKNKATSTKPAGLELYRLSGVSGISAVKYYSKMGIADEIIDFEEKLD